MTMAQQEWVERVLHPAHLISNGLVLLLLGLAACGQPEETDTLPANPDEASTASARQAPLKPGKYVGSAQCKECHPAAYESWSGSHHDRAMAVASPATVLGNFDDAVFEHMGQTARFFKRADEYWVNIEGPDGKPQDFQVSHTFGYEPLQQYLVPMDGGRMQCLTVAWDTVAQRWFTLYPDEQFEAEDPLHWTGLYQRWNAMCAECHSTGLRKNYDPESDSYDTTWEEINVACEACHGPAEGHLEWSRDPDAFAAALAAEAPGAEPVAKGFARALRLNDGPAQIEACAPCHSRRATLSDGPSGGGFLDDYLPHKLHQGLYHADGQILGEVYVYGSFLQSKMHQSGVACSDCHDSHSLQLRLPGNGLCMQCHTVDAPLERFPDLQKKNYDTPEHHFHAAGSEGAQCVNCHMPQTTYMQVDPRRDHSMRVPRPDLSVLLGTPNACNGCHDDKTPEWARDEVEKRFGKRTDEKPHYAHAFEGIRAGRLDALSSLADIAMDRERPVIVRATAYELLEQGGPAAAGTILGGLQDPEPLVRSAALRAMDGLPAAVRNPLLLPLLDDPVRSVRVEAARLLAEIPRSELPAETRALFDKTLAEFRAAQGPMGDMPGARFNLGRLESVLGNTRAAEKYYRQALKLDPYFLPARFNLVNLLNAGGRNSAAEKLLREGIERVPEDGELRYSLGLLLAEMNDLPGATEALSAAAERLPTRHRIRYNLGLALQSLGRMEDAERALLAAQALDDGNPQYTHTLVLLYAERKEWERALIFAELLVRQTPDDPSSMQLMLELRRQLGR